MAKVPVKTKSDDDKGGETDAAAVPHGATYLAGLHDEVKALCKHMDEEGAAQDHEDVKALHGRMRKSLDEHLDDIKSTFAKAYPDVEGLEDEEAEEEEAGEEKSAKARRKAAGRALKVKTAPAPALPASAADAVMAAGEFLAELAAGGNLTPTQKAALHHHAGALKSAATPPDDDSDPEEEAHLKALISKEQERAAANRRLLEQALGRK